MNCAYDELYLELVQRRMGDMFDYAVNTLGFELEEFSRLFLVSGMAYQLEMCNPTYAAGKNGCELARQVIETCGLSCRTQEDIAYLDKSPEYWIGWAMAYYQWYSRHSFREIIERVTIGRLYRMYAVYHEMDVQRLAEDLDEIFREDPAESMLRRLRRYAGLSQSQLAAKAEVPLRQIQLFEQGQRDIRKTQAQTLQNLSHALGCTMEELLA